MTFLDSVKVDEFTLVEYEKTHGREFMQTLGIILLKRHQLGLLTSNQISSLVCSSVLQNYCTENNIAFIYPKIKHTALIKFYFDPDYKEDGLCGAFRIRDIDSIEMSKRDSPLVIIKGIEAFLTQKDKALKSEDKNSLYKYIVKIQSGKINKTEDQKIEWIDAGETISVLYKNGQITILYTNVTKTSITQAMHIIKITEI